MHSSLPLIEKRHLCVIGLFTQNLLVTASPSPVYPILLLKELCDRIILRVSIIWNLIAFGCAMLYIILSFRKCSLFLGEELTVRVVLKGAAPFSVLWSLSGYLYLLALCRISKVDVSAILCCSQAFIFLLSWIGLKDRFMGVRVSNQIGYRVLCEWFGNCLFFRQFWSNLFSAFVCSLFR